MIQFAKKTGDYSVLSHADLCVIALTLSIDRREKTIESKEGAENTNTDVTSSTNIDKKSENESESRAQTAEENVEEVEADGGEGVIGLSTCLGDADAPRREQGKKVIGIGSVGRSEGHLEEGYRGARRETM